VTQYDTDILAASPDGYWKCDDASGSTLVDSSPGNHPLVGSAFVENYRIPGPSLAQIPYATDWINTGTPPLCATTTVGSYAAGVGFSVEGWWAGVGPMGGARSTLLEKGFGSAGEARPWYYLGVDGDGTPVFWFRSTTPTDYKLTTTIAINDATYPQRGPYHHLVGTFHPTSGAVLYIDGIPAKSLAVANTGWGTAAQGISSGIFAGDKSGSWVAALAVYQSVLTPAGVLAHFNLGIQGNAFYVSQLATQITSCQAALAEILAAVKKTY